MRNLFRSMLVVAVIASVMTVGSAAAAQNDTIFVSKAGGFGPAGDDGSFDPSISADGRFVAFGSNAANLDVNESNDTVTDVFVRDLVSDITTLVSRASGATGAGGDANSFSPSISADGRFVAFHSGAGNLDVDESNDGVLDVFVRDLASDTTTLVSRASGAAGTGGDGGSARPSISADGRFVAFDSAAGNLDVNESNDAVRDVYVRDLASDTTTLVSRASGATGAGGDNGSFRPSISADGRFVAFDSGAANLDVNESNDNFTDVYVRDLASSTTTLVSRASGATGAGGDANSFSPSISADGRFVAFDSGAANLDVNESNDNFTDVFVRDLLSDTTTLVSRASGATDAGGNGSSFDPSISADGRFVAFHSDADNLDVNESNDAFSDVYVRDLASSTTTLVSRAPGATGAGGDAASFSPSISADGRFVAFSSDADNLDVNESNDAVTDVYVRDVLGPQPSPDLSIDDVLAREGNKVTKPFTFTVHLDGIPATPVTVDFVTIDRTAKVPSDYVFTSGTLRFAPGEHEKQIVVQVVGDRKKEPTETFLVRLQSARGAPVSDDRAVGTIRNDDR